MNLTSFEVGQTVFIQTPTFFYLGKVESLSATDIVLKNASLVHDTGRHGAFCKTGEPAEVEVYMSDMLVSIPRTSIVSAVLNWPHHLPKESK